MKGQKMNDMDKKKEKEYKASYDFKDLLKVPGIKIILITAGAFLMLYLSKYVFRASADTISAFKRLKRVIKE